jgi:hypothetical protein
MSRSGSRPRAGPELTPTVRAVTQYTAVLEHQRSSLARVAANGDGGARLLQWLSTTS